MTITQLNVNAVLMAIVKYIGFVWSVSWRTVVLSLLFAVLAGVALGVLSAANSWPPAAVEILAPYLGLPITLIVFGWVVTRKIFQIVR